MSEESCGRWLEVEHAGVIPQGEVCAKFVWSFSSLFQLDPDAHVEVSELHAYALGIMKSERSYPFRQPRASCGFSPWQPLNPVTRNKCER